VTRATAPVVGVVLLVAIAVACAGAVTATLSVAPGEPPPTASFEVRADSAIDRITVTHLGGDAVSPEALSVFVTVDGQSLTHQPPVPFFAATGFRAGPTGPFNAATSGDWRAGQTGSVRLAATNAPGIEPGDRVRVTLSTDRATLARLAATAA
jgi:FlaG/FlaF family flagellin (archaellin)